MREEWGEAEICEDAALGLSGEDRQRIPTCPECGVVRLTFEALGYHIERHRVVTPIVRNRRGRVLTRPCPQVCGRNFLKQADLKEHAPNCDGAIPLGDEAEKLHPWMRVIA